MAAVVAVWWQCGGSVVAVLAVVPGNPCCGLFCFLCPHNHRRQRKVSDGKMKEGVKNGDAMKTFPLHTCIFSKSFPQFSPIILSHHILVLPPTATRVDRFCMVAVVAVWHRSMSLLSFPHVIVVNLNTILLLLIWWMPMRMRGDPLRKL